MTAPRPHSFGDGVGAGGATPPADPAAAARWARLDAALDTLLDLDLAEREARLEEFARDDADFAGELRALLASDAGASAADFLAGTVVPPPVVAGAPGTRCGPYELVELIGRGGMGSVWRARRVDGQFDSEVAIKLLGGALLDAGAARRFRREGEILAKLQHPNIGALRDAGITADGQPYLVLELVHGAPIDAWVDERGRDPDFVVRLVLQVLAAVAHAHARLVVHRDLKPSNILVDATGRARLLDFGIAKLITDDSGGAVATAITRAGGRLLTPRYAAPEQMRGGDVSTATDVYALGVLLCELLTGQLPYRLSGDSMRALETAILDDPPIAPSELADASDRRRLLRGDLDTIVLKALRKEPEARYATVDALADDLQRWLNGHPVSARPASAGYRLRRFMRRHAVAVSAAGVVVLAIVGGAAAALWQSREARIAQRRAEAVTAFVTGIFTDADPSAGDGTALSGRELLLQAYARLDEAFGDRPDERLELQFLILESMLNLEAHVEAEPIANDARARAIARHGDTHARVVKADLALATIYRYTARIDSMAAAVDRGVAGARALVPADPAYVVDALIERVHLMIDQGREPEAAAEAREVLTLAESTLPLEHELVEEAVRLLTTALNLANADPDTIAQVAARMVRVTSARYAATPAHPNAISARMGYAQSLSAQGRIREAIAEYDSAIALDRSARPQPASRRAFAFGNGALYRMYIGRHAEALASYDSSVATFQQLGDTTGVGFRILRGNRAAALLMVGQYDEAIRDVREARVFFEQTWGPSHLLSVILTVREATARAANDDFSGAQSLLDALAANGRDTVRRGEYALARTLLARRRGDHARALRAADAVLADTALRQRLTAPDRAALLVERGLAAAAAQRPEEARNDFAEAIAAFREAEMDETERERIARRELARLAGQPVVETAGRREEIRNL